MNTTTSTSTTNTNNPRPNPMRVLIRPPPTPQPPPPPPRLPPQQPSPSPSPSTPQPPPLPSGIVVIGFISRRHSLTSLLLNRILDSDIFGPSARRRDTPLHVSDESNDEGLSDEVRVWFRNHSVSYYYDQANSFLFLQFSSTNCPAVGCDYGFEDFEGGELQGMLFMFTVCHVIVHVQEGSRFDAQLLKNLRLLQSAKHALMPFLKSNSILPSTMRPSTSSSRPPASSSSKSPSPRIGSGISNRNSSLSIMSSLGSYTTLFPGQCTPVMLFAFFDDFSEMMNSSIVAEDSNEPSSSQSGMSSLARSTLSGKGSGSVAVLSRSTNNFECSLCKKLQSSIEAQIRFLIKKCRILTGTESSNVGSRSGAISASAPLLTLDASRSVVLLDSSIVFKGESLDFVTGLIEDVLSRKATPDALLLESLNQNGNKDGIMTLKEFISRQADILRGKGGMISNANSGSGAGVGMVAVAAAAAAAASAASGRATSVPELPSLEMWLNSSQLILKGILLAKPSSVGEPDPIKRKFRQRNGAPPLVESTNSKGTDPPSTAVSLLESGKGINRKFSALWCQRVLPFAREVYLKDLPPCYPTSQHEAQLEKALNSFHSLVKGPSVMEFSKKLEEECTSIWKDGRQLCDAISLTGKPCMHQRHDVKNDGLPSDSKDKKHSSGFVFLHACACGRSRKLRADPFDFESANTEFNNFSDCDKLLPVLQLPNACDSCPIQPSSWSVVRIGGSQYYDPSKGLVQAGFSHNQKFLLRWTIAFAKNKQAVLSFANALRQGSFRGKADLKFESPAVKDGVKSSATLSQPGEVQSGVEDQKCENGSLSDSRKISFGRGFPVTTMKKAFSEVVAGSTSSNSAFPPLQSKTQLPSVPGKGVKKNAGRVADEQQIRNSVSDVQRSESSVENYSKGAENSSGMNNVGPIDGNPFLHIGSTVVPLNVDDGKNASETKNANGGNTRFDPSIRQFVVYVGFEHECPRGHRFILSPELLNQLGQPYTLSEEFHVTHPVEHVNRKNRGPLKLGKNDGHSKVHRAPNGNATILHKVTSLERSGEADSDTNVRGISLSKPMASLNSAVISSPGTDLQQSQTSLDVENNGPAFSLLNRNLPLYLNCPHCKEFENKDGQNLKFAGTISQLQRIFVVTPPFPAVLATNPVVQFEGSHQPEGVPNLEQHLQFNIGSQIILPPESFVSIRLPFIYGLKDREKGLLPLNPFEHQPELTAWIKPGTVLQTVCRGSSQD